MIRVKCDCGAAFNAKDDRSGTAFKCSECGTTLCVSRPELEVSPVPSADQLLAAATTSRFTSNIIWAAVAIAAVITLLLTSRALQEARDNKRRYLKEIAEDAQSAVAFQQRQSIRDSQRNRDGLAIQLSAAKLRRSKTNLDSAKKLLIGGKNEEARTLLEKAVNDAPESESGKEAAEILRTLR